MPVLHPDLQKKLDELRAKKDFNCQEWLNNAASKINAYFTKSGLSGAVIGCSGGVDSSLVVAVLDWTMKNTDSPLKKILPVALPIHSTHHIQNRAAELCDKLGLELVSIDQTDLFDSLESRVSSALSIKSSQFASGQLRSYMRTPVLYFCAQLLSVEGHRAVVVSTGNRDEDFGIYYYCKAGDGVADVNFIHDLHKSEVFTMAKYLDLPEIIVTSPPSADLWADQTDEDELGLTYSFVELYLTWIVNFSDEERAQFEASLSPEGLEQLKSWTQSIERIRRNNEHKLHVPLFL